MNAIEVRKSAAALRALWVLGNEYLQDVAPWTTFKEDPDAAAMQIRMALNLIRFYAVISSPFIPDASAQLLTAMNAEDATWPEDASQAITALPAGHSFAVPEVTFRKISDDERAGWQEQFAGVRT
jgi:methionyl-tRNA synthetase